MATVVKRRRRHPQAVGSAQHTEVGKEQVTQLLSSIQRQLREMGGKAQLEMPDVEERDKDQRGQHRDVPGNVNGRALKVYFPLADTDVPLKHNLGRVTNRFQVKDIDKAAQVYRARDGGRNTLMLRCDTADTHAVIIVLPGGH